MDRVNNAAINYYFRSKEALVDRCMCVTLHNAFNWEDIAKLPEWSASELRLACVQNPAAALMVILAPQLFGPFGFDLSDEATRDSFVNRLVARRL